MMPENADKTKVLGIRLPEDHPIFSIEAGRRSEVIRSWLDMGCKLEQLGEQMQKILGLLEAGPPEARPVKLDSGKGGGFDKKEFLSYFD